MANISGATSISYTATSTGSYKVTVAHPAGCNKTSAAITVISSCRSVEDATSETAQLEIYPNPVSDVLHVESAASYTRLIITAADGRIIKQLKITNSATEVNTCDLAPGVYFVTLTSLNGKTYNNKLIKN